MTLITLKGDNMDPIFQVHILNAEGIKNTIVIADKFNNLLSDISDYIGKGREAAIVKTKLEEACFFAKKASAVSNQQK